jgi:Arm DNA-binding domain
MRLTNAVAEQPMPPGKNEHFAWDDAVPGFGMRWRSSGHKTWVLQYRVGARSSRMTLGRHPALSASAARAIAVKLYARVRLGQDPAGDKAAALAESLEKRIAAKWVQFKQAGIEPACYLYRHFDPAGDLLYAGVSLSPLRRNKSHTTIAEWRQAIFKILIEPFATREDAL